MTSRTARRRRSWPAQSSIMSDCAAALHRGAIVGGAGAEPKIEAREAPLTGRCAEPDQPAAGLRLSHALPLCLRPLQDRHAKARRVEPRPRRLLPPAHELTQALICTGGVRLDAGETPAFPAQKKCRPGDR